MDKKLDETHVITIINQKGGVGKTSTCTLMAALLGLADYRCLVVDNDSQANTTSTLLPDVTIVTKSIVDIFHLDAPTQANVEECIYKTPYKGVDLIPSRPEHEKTSDYLISLLGRKSIHKLLKRAIKQVEDRYDYILIDTHPDLGSAVQNALCCSDYVLIPVKPDAYSYQGVTPIINRIIDISSDEDLNPDLSLLGIFMTCAEPRSGASNEFFDYYKDTFGDDFIPISIRLDRNLGNACNYLIPAPYLLGIANFQLSGSWKSIYDYIELMRYTEIINDDDYAVLRVTYELLEKRLGICIPTDAYDSPYISQITWSTTIGSLSAPCGNDPHMNYEELLAHLNNSQELRDRVQACLVQVGSPSKNIRYRMEEDNANTKYSFVRLSALKRN